jgi:anti-anti-sigma regulatory factor
VANSSHLTWEYMGHPVCVSPLVKHIGPWFEPSEPPDEAIEFRRQLWQVLAETERPLLLDLRRVPLSRGWAWVLFPLLKKCRELGRSWAVCITPDAAEVMVLTKLDRVFPFFSEFELAIASLGSADQRA